MLSLVCLRRYWNFIPHMNLNSKVYPSGGRLGGIPPPPTNRNVGLSTPCPPYCFDPKMLILSFSCSFRPFCPNCPSPPTPVDPIRETLNRYKDQIKNYILKTCKSIVKDQCHYKKNAKGKYCICQGFSN